MIDAHHYEMEYDPVADKIMDIEHDLIAGFDFQCWLESVVTTGMDFINDAETDAERVTGEDRVPLEDLRRIIAAARRMQKGKK